MTVNFKYQTGLNIIELMVASVISLVVLGGISVMLVTSNKANQVNSELQHLQEGARYALEQISRDVRMSGYYGCVQDNNPTDAAGPILSKATTNPFTSASLAGFDYANGGSPYVTVTADDLVIQYAAEVTELSNDMLTTLDSLTVDSTLGLAEQQVAMLASCESGDVFVISDITGSVISHETNTTSGEGMPNDNMSDSLYAVYPAGTPLYVFSSIRYYVDNDPANGNLPTLFRDVGGIAVPFIPGVDSFQAQFGVDTSNDGIPDAYVSSSAVLNWATVASVRVAMLLRTEDEYGTDEDRNKDQYPIGVLDYNFTDDNSRARRRLFQTTVYLRNSI